MSTSEQYPEIYGAAHPLRSYLEALILNGESLEEKMESPVTATGSLQLRLLLTSKIGTFVIHLDGTSKSVLLGRRQSDTVGKTEDIFCLEIPHVAKGCIITTVYAQSSDLMKSSVKFSGNYVISQTALSKSGLTERVLQGKVLSGIWRTSGEDGYLCLELNSPE